MKTLHYALFGLALGITVSCGPVNRAEAAPITAPAPAQAAGDDVLLQKVNYGCGRYNPCRPYRYRRPYYNGGNGYNGNGGYYRNNGYNRYPYRRYCGPGRCCGPNCWYGRFRHGYCGHGCQWYRERIVREREWVRCWRRPCPPYPVYRPYPQPYYPGPY